MKRIFVALFLCFCIVLSATACAPQVSPEETTEKSEAGEQTSMNDIENTTKAENENLDELTTEKITDVPTENITEEPSETETAEPEVDVADRIAGIFNAIPETPICRVENTLVEMIMSGKVEGQDLYAEKKMEGRESIRTVDGMVDSVSVVKQKDLMSMAGYSEFSEYTLINGEVGEYELYGYIPGVSAGGHAVFQKWIVERDGEETDTEESGGNIYEDTGVDMSLLTSIFGEYSLEEETGVYVVEFSEYNGENEEFVSELFGDSIAPDMIENMSMKICINAHSCLPLSIDMDFDLDVSDELGSNVVVEATARIWFEYYGGDYSILPDNYDEYVLVGDMSYRDIAIEEIDYYFSDLTAFESLSFETISSVDLYYSIDGSSRDIAVRTSEKDVVNLGYYDGEFVYAVDADMTVMDESQKIKMLYKDGAFSIYINGELATSQSLNASDAAAILDRSYYDKISLEAYEIADIKVTNDTEGTKTVVLKSDYSIRVRETIDALGFEEYELIKEEQEYTVLLDEDNYLLALEYKVSGEFKDADGVTYYIESTSAIGIIGDADFSALNVNLPSIGA